MNYDHEFVLWCAAVTDYLRDLRLCDKRNSLVRLLEAEENA